MRSYGSVLYLITLTSSHTISLSLSHLSVCLSSPYLVPFSLWFCLAGHSRVGGTRDNFFPVRLWVDSFPPGFIDAKVQFCPQWVGDKGVRSGALAPGLAPSAVTETQYVEESRLAAPAPFKCHNLLPLNCFSFVRGPELKAWLEPNDPGCHF